MAAWSIGSLTPNKSLGPVPSQPLLDILRPWDVWSELATLLAIPAGLGTRISHFSQLAFETPGKGAPLSSVGSKARINPWSSG